MDLQRTEEETVESIKQWVRENGVAVVVGLAIGLGAIVGIRYWWQFQKDQSEAASVIYEQVSTALASKKYDVVFKQGQVLVQDYSGTPYASLAALSLAKAKYESGNLTGAQLHLNWVIDNASDSGVSHIARIRLARLLLDGKDYTGMAKLIDGQKDSAFQSFYDELRGDVAAIQGNQSLARDAYRLALAAAKGNPQRKQMIQMKLDDMAVSVGATTSPVATEK